MKSRLLRPPHPPQPAVFPPAFNSFNAESITGGTDIPLRVIHTVQNPIAAVRESALTVIHFSSSLQ
jgi:hypothetical protein